MEFIILPTQKFGRSRPLALKSFVRLFSQSQIYEMFIQEREMAIKDKPVYFMQRNCGGHAEKI